MPKKILAVDDERHIVQLVEVNLQRAGYEVVTAFGGQEALEKVEAETPDLIVLDVMMPHMDGFEVLGKLRTAEATASLPIILMTAKCADPDAPRAWRAGSDCYLTKPFSPIDLLRCVKSMLGFGTPLSDIPSWEPTQFKC